MNNDNVTGFGIGLLTGAVVGGAIALLYAPQSGKKTRKLIKDKTTEAVDTVKEEASEVVDEVKEKAGGIIDKVKQAASNSSRDGKAAAAEPSHKGKVAVKATKS